MDLRTADRAADSKAVQIILVQHVGNEHLQEWMPITDDRIIRNKVEKYCQHGRVCNYMVRKGICGKHSMEPGESPFCHEPGCADDKHRRARNISNPAASFLYRT